MVQVNLWFLLGQPQPKISTSISMNIHYLNNLNVINSTSRDIFGSIQSPGLTKLMLFISDIGGPGSIALYCLVLVMLMWLHKKYNHLIQFIFTMSISAFVAVGIKEVLKIQRPSGGLITEVGYSFISAHTLIITVFLILLIYSYKDHFKKKVIRTLFILVSILCIFLVAISRVYLGVHYTTDVLGGLFVGLIISSISVLLYNRRNVL